MTQPLEIELGCGDGSFLANYAQAHPERNFIGIERLLGRIRKLERKSRRAGLSNVRGIRIESWYFLRFLLPAHSAAALHLYFPDPWPKRRHRHHRLVNLDFPAVCQQALQKGGTVYLRTDDRDYFEQMVSVFRGSPALETVETPESLARCITDFEGDFNKRGIPTLRTAYRVR